MFDMAHVEKCVWHPCQTWVLAALNFNCSFFQILEMNPEDEAEEDGANIDLDSQRKGKCVVLKTSTRQVMAQHHFLSAMIGKVNNQLCFSLVQVVTKINIFEYLGGKKNWFDLDLFYNYYRPSFYLWLDL